MKTKSYETPLDERGLNLPATEILAYLCYASLIIACIRSLVIGDWTSALILLPVTIGILVRDINHDNEEAERARVEQLRALQTYHDHAN